MTIFFELFLNFFFLFLQDDATFTITVDGKTFHFQAQEFINLAHFLILLHSTDIPCILTWPQATHVGL